jgi:acyl carrier protein
VNDINLLANELAKLLEDILDEPVDPSARDASLIGDYGANSMDVVDIVERLERHFKITIPNNDIEKLVTFNDVLIYVAKRLPCTP